MRSDLGAEIVSDALAMAVARRRPPVGVIHHSDRGSQYTSVQMGKTLAAHGITPSMGSRGQPHDNAACESAIGTIKPELVDRHVFPTRDIARLRLFDYIAAFYNPHRMHTTQRRSEPRRVRSALPRNPRQPGDGSLETTCQAERVKSKSMCRLSTALVV